MMMDATVTLLLAAALLPVVVMMLFVLWRDKKNPEPASQLIKGFVFGIFSAVGSLAFSMPILLLGIASGNYENAIEATWHSFFVAAIPEELSKLLFLWLLLRHNPFFDEHLDGVVYAVCIGLGFAAFENVQYLFAAGDSWLTTAVARGLLSVPGHFFFAVLMGYYYSLVHFGHDSKRNRLLVIAAPVIAHGIYDSIAMTTEVTPGMQLLFTVALLAFCNELRKLCTRHIGELIEADKYRNFG